MLSMNAFPASCRVTNCYLSPYLMASSVKWGQACDLRLVRDSLVVQVLKKPLSVVRMHLKHRFDKLFVQRLTIKGKVVPLKGLSQRLREQRAGHCGAAVINASSVNPP
ncbi:hypothetical protein BCY86_02720 [Pajaroellobacter abortibovis]|uniref:Uncharacterized protein n=1 Tax=Pajaroellobacter abortibovis TaxID=1882918 RepID=A0A1L6MW04_9BACT|nr:hypothetical protein BCY86_02720 [Pajaroellobacter abortibovis]